MTLQKQELLLLNKLETTQFTGLNSQRIHSYFTKINLENDFCEILQQVNNSELNQDMIIPHRLFLNSILYGFLRAKQEKYITKSVFVSDAVRNPQFQSILQIQTENGIEQPIVDLVFYTEDKDKQIDKSILLMLQNTRSRRMEQTYKWKLLMEIASTENSIRDKYDIRYEPKHIPIVCFATVNFYDEINQPQHRGMFKFFDASFIGKPIESSFISNLSSLIDFVNGHLSTR